MGAAGSSQLQPIPLLPTASPEKRLQAPQKFKKSRRPKKPLRSTRYLFYPTCFKEVSPVGGWGVSPTGKSESVRFVRACRACGRGEAACARETMLLPRLGCGSSKCAPVCVAARVPFPCRRKTTPLFYACLLIAVRSLQINSKLFLVASPCFSLLPAAFLLLPAAFRLKKSKSMRLVPGAVRRLVRC